MTREQARKVYISGQGSYDFIDKIYDSFEARTCSNCEHCHYGCSIQGSILYFTPETGLSNFGCNKFKSKD